MTEQTEQWAVIELMGHQKIAGRYQEAPGGLHRVDVPGDEPGQFRFTRLYSLAAIYSITPVTEQSARAAARLLAPQPITVFGIEAELKRLAQPAKPGDTLDYDNPDFYDDPYDDDDDLTDVPVDEYGAN